MILPIGDTPNPRGVPVVTWILIGLNVLAFVAVLPLSWQPADPRDPAFAAYLATGFAAVGGDALLRAGSLIPAVGASGAISGVLGLYFWWFPRNRVRLLLFFPVILPIEVPARIVLAIYLVVDNLLPSLFASRDGGGVAYGAHIGGFIAGLLIAVVADRLLAAPRRDIPPEAEPLFRGARAAAGVDPAGKLTLAAGLEREGRAHAALAGYQRLLADHPRHPLRTEAHLGAARVLLEPLGLPTSAYQHALSALEEAATDAERLAARALLARIAQRLASVPRGAR